MNTTLDERMPLTPAQRCKKWREKYPEKVRDYTKGNIIIVSQLVNKIKCNLSFSEIEEFLPKIVSFYKELNYESK